jgi:tRNA dimethylallyltransferase
MPNKPALLAIVGPTASGKSHLAIQLAKQHNGEIINCDSVQMFRQFDIGSVKIPEAEQEGIPHYLIGILNPEETYAAGEYARLARETMASLEARGKLPIVVGGTGFYLRALVDGLFQGPLRNAELRRRLQLRAEQKGRDYLHRLLRRLDPVSAGNIHPHDTPKIIRALEVCLQARRPISELFQQGRQALEGYQVLKLGLDPPRAELAERINQRTAGLFEKGLIEEVRAILSSGVPKSAAPFQSHGYRQVLEHLEGKLSVEEAIQLAQTKTRQYAKRQMTWFRKEPGVRWFSGFGTDPELQIEAGNYVLEQLTRQ